MAELTPSNPFTSIARVNGTSECWSARDIQPLLGYTEWRRFEDAIERAMLACANSGANVTSNFVGADKVSNSGPSQRDYHLSRYACYLVAMNGDPRKPEISLAQTYFAVKTREAEVAQAGPSSLDVLAGMVAHLQEQARRTIVLESSQRETDARLDTLEGNHGWYAAVGVAKLRGWPSSESWLNPLGRRASKIGKSLGMQPSKIPHARYGTQNGWPEHIWDQAFDELHGDA